MPQPRGKASRGRGRPFPKDCSPNPGGRIIADFMLAVMADPNRKLDQRMEATTWLADRAFGKPAQVVEHGGDPDRRAPILLT
jgi:hypothetical protein